MTEQELLDKIDRLETTLREITVGYMKEPDAIALSKVREAALKRLVEEIKTDRAR
jgi:hypothetical protein